MGKNELDLALLGLSGDQPNDSVYHELMQSYFGDSCSFAAYKHLCGEYYTASAFALWLATVILHGQHVPSVVRIGGLQKKRLDNILVYNHYRNTEHAFMLLSLAT